MADCAVSEEFVADLFSWFSTLDPSRIQSAGQYLVLSHVGRGLVQLDAFGNVVCDAAASWEVNESWTKFNFELSECK